MNNVTYKTIKRWNRFSALQSKWDKYLIICVLCELILVRGEWNWKKEIRTNENLLLVLLGGDTYMYNYKIFKKKKYKLFLNV